MRRFVRENGLSLFFFAIFALTLVGQSFAGRSNYNAIQAAHGESAVVTSTDFGGSVMENWQSEFLAVGTMVVFTIYLRQRGSPESKPVGAHDETASSG